MAHLKYALRRDMAARRRAQDPALGERQSRVAQKFILHSQAWRSAPCVGLYMPVNAEISTSLLLDDALATGKMVCLPRIKGPGDMEFFACPAPADLKPGPMGILEPQVAEDTPATCPDLLIVPGLAFDMLGTRLGYGGGYYDRYLNGCGGSPPMTIGLCFSFQIVSSLPAACWDVPVKGICSEEGLHLL